MKNSILKTLIMSTVYFSVILYSFNIHANTPLKENNLKNEILKYGYSYALFAGKTGGKISMSEINNCSSLSIKGCHWSSRVFSYTLFIIKDGQEQAYKGTTEDLTQKMRNALEKLSSGDVLEFARIRARNNTGIENYIKGIRLTVR